MTYDLRRLRLSGLIRRIEHTNRTLNQQGDDYISRARRGKAA
jgi:hypothetical protein